MEDKGEVLRPDPARVMEGLRDTGYNFNTAVADIIDNSISAGATKINVLVEMTPLGEVIVYFADNGCGMDYDGLKNAMQYGSKKREDPASLGKFGLGLKTASTAFCRSLSVLSKNKVEDPYKKVKWDLDYIAHENEWYLLPEEPSPDEIGFLQETAGNGPGALVIWEKVDRLLPRQYTNNNVARNALNRQIDGLAFHISMVYQRYLDPNDSRARTLEIYLNGNKVSTWDPFCISESETEPLGDEEVEVELGNGQIAVFKLKAYVIPHRDQFSTEEACKNARVSNDMQGFYVYRENRLLYQGGWLGMFSREPHGTLLRVEFSFDHLLDEAFNVDIKKSRILLNDEIFKYIRDNFISGPRRAADERYRKGTRKAIDNTSHDAHDASNRNIDNKADTVQEAKVVVTNAETNEVEITNSKGTFRHHLKISTPQKPGQYHVIPIDQITDGMLWEPCIVESHHAVRINQGHPYYQKVYYPVLSQGVMITGMDALLWALAEAELSTFNENTREQYEDLRMQVSRIIRKLIADLPDPDLPTEE